MSDGNRELNQRVMAAFKAAEEARIRLLGVLAILVEDEKFWDEVAALFLREAQTVDETLSEDGWTDPEDSWLPSWPNDRDRILAKALRQVLGERPAWRCVDTSKARRVEL